MLQYQFVEPGKPFVLTKIEPPYKCVVLIEREVDPDFRWEVSKKLVASGCRYMMAWGLECSLWDDSVDHANLERFAYGDIPPEQDVLTTWHTDETLREVLGFAKCSATRSFDDVTLNRCLVLDISEVPREAEIRDIYRAAGREDTQG